MSMRQARVPYLDGLRGIAAFAVVIFHMNVFFSVLLFSENIVPTILKTMQARLTNGNFAVCIFFVLNGFVLIDPIARSCDTSRIGEYALRRYFRLTPIALVSVLMAYVIGTAGGFRTLEMPEFGPGFQWMAAEYQYPFRLADALHHGLIGVYTGESSYNLVLWTIQVELWGTLFLFAFAGMFFGHERFTALAVVAASVLIEVFGGMGVYGALFLAGASLRVDNRLRGRWFFAPLAIYLGSVDQWSPEAGMLAWKSVADTVPLARSRRGVIGFRDSRQPQPAKRAKRRAAVMAGTRLVFRLCAPHRHYLLYRQQSLSHAGARGFPAFGRAGGGDGDCGCNPRGGRSPYAPCGRAFSRIRQENRSCYP
jgi:hypothetical protein